MTEALEAIRETADQNGGEIEWSDVRDDLTSGQWGRLIEKGILVDGEEGFEIADREAYDEALDGDGSGGGIDVPDVDIDEEEAKWSQWDKMAAVGSVLMMLGYMRNSIRNTIGSTVDIVLGPLDTALPFYAVILAVAMLTGLYSTLLQANLMNTERIGKYQERMKAMQEKQKDVRERKKEAEERDASEAELEALENEMQQAREEQMEAMADNLGMFKEQFRPMVWIMLFTIPLFLWMYWKVPTLEGTEQYVIMPLVGEVQWQEGFIGPMFVWIVWYFLCSMGFTQLLRKALNIDMTPSST
ncbi:EMC3/TMCO1 family protein [Halostagnicola bangensis]